MEVAEAAGQPEPACVSSYHQEVPQGWRLTAGR